VAVLLCLAEDVRDGKAESGSDELCVMSVKVRILTRRESIFAGVLLFQHMRTFHSVYISEEQFPWTQLEMLNSRRRRSSDLIANYLL
jgi:hypothetical protein